LWIETDTFTGDGVIRADGGNGGGTRYDDTYGQGGGGAGGRVAIYAGSNTFTSTSGTISVDGGSGHEGGEIGSIHISVTATSLVTVTAGFAVTPTAGSIPLTVTFSNLSISSGEIDSCRWNFGDGVTSTLTNPLHVYTQTGSFTVVLTATTGRESDVEVKSDYILATTWSPVTVTADFVATPISGSAPLTVTFTNLSISSDEVESCQWAFGDGSTLLTTGGETSVLENPTHVYTQSGSFTVTLTVTTGSESDSEIKTDYITVYAPSEPELVTRTITYTYDGLHRLTGADYSSGERFAYAYDAVGNMTAMTATITNTVATAKAYDAANRLTSVTTDGVTRTLEWSNAGELLRDGDDTYAWNSAGRLVRATVGGVTSRFAYLGDGGRISMTVGSETTTYTLDLAAPLVQVLVAHESAHQRVSEYLYGVARIGEYGGGWRYYLADHLGSVRSLIEMDGSVEETRTYRPYGLPLDVAGTVSSIYGFTGEQTDPTGLLYLRARMYAPSLGQFTSRDLWPGDTMQSNSMNGFNYVNCNPLRYIDPTGLRPTLNGIAEGRYSYSCRCGWIDWAHASPGAARELLTRLSTEVEEGSDTYKMIWARQLVGGVGHGEIGYLLWYHTVPVIVRKDLSKPSLEEVGFSIFKTVAEEVESIQGIAGGSSYALEDLPSNLIGFELARRNRSHSLSESEMKMIVKPICGAILDEARDKKWSTEVYEIYEQLGLFDQKNTSWSPPRPPVSCAIDGECAGQSREWPFNIWPYVWHVSPQRGGRWWIPTLVEEHNLWIAQVEDGVFAIDWYQDPPPGSGPGQNPGPEPR
jgi:RHS repeat-associated protein